MMEADEVDLGFDEAGQGMTQHTAHPHQEGKCPPGPPVADVDPKQGPFVGNGHVRRVVPFAVTATIALSVAIPMTTWARPAFAVAGTALTTASLVTGLCVPWRRLPRTLQIAPPAILLAGTLFLLTGTHTFVGSPFLTIAVLPLMWLALYESHAAVIAATLLTGSALWFTDASGSAEPPSPASTVAIVFIVCGAGMGVTLQRTLAQTRALSGVLAQQQDALTDSASMLDALPDLVSRYRVADHVLTYCNAAWAARYDLAQSDVIGRPIDDFLSADEEVGFRKQLSRLGPDNPILVDSEERTSPHSPGRWLLWIDRYFDGGRRGPEVLSIGRDVTDQHDAKLALAESEARYRGLADNSADVVWHITVRPSPHFDYMSPSVERVLGFPPEYFLDDFDRLLDALDEEGRRAIVDGILGVRNLERFDLRFRVADGSIVIGETRAIRMRGGLQGVSRDVTEIRALQRGVEELALRDPLTDLANRRLFDELLDADLARTQRAGGVLAVAFLDLDGFKLVNDTHGHAAGDIVLCATARRLQQAVRRADNVARVGGDEFVVTYEPLTEGADGLIERIGQILAQPIEVAPSVFVTCPASIGTADTRTTGFDRTDLIAAADAAMYRIKRERRHGDAGLAVRTSM